MKPLTETPITSPHESFNVKVKNQDPYDPFLHKHDMYELTFLPKVRALRFMGDSAKEIFEDELVLIAPNLPHCWHIVASDTRKVPALVIHFKEDFMGGPFFQKPELKSFRHILKLATRGIKFSSDQQVSLLPAMKSINEFQGLARLIELFKIFEQIGEFDPTEFELMASAHYQAINNDDDYENINLIFNYVQKNFSQHISLQQAAQLAHLSTSAFCRYFKKCTGKTFMDFVKEVRISHACHLLQYRKDTITEISFRCGYNNMANFNRQFRQITHRSPKEYQQLYTIDKTKHYA